MSEQPLVLAINAGSSSLKASLLSGKNHIAVALGERLNTPAAYLKVQFSGTHSSFEKKETNMDHEQALHHIMEILETHELLQKIVGVGHRVVHGGKAFSESALVNQEVLDTIESLIPLAPLHNPHNLKMIKIAQKILPKLPNVAVFDTSFHQTLPITASTYPLPKEYRDAGIRKYGFHGTSVQFVSRKSAQILNKIRNKPDSVDDNQYNMIVCHLGSGASITAVHHGKSVETSMGFSPLAGVMMNTRSGDIDSSIVGYACEHLSKTVHDVLDDLNKRSGLKGMVHEGESTDMRHLLAEHDMDVVLAVDMWVYRIAQHIAMSLVALHGPLDALVFTAGIGEHSWDIRQRVVKQLVSFLPLELDDARNKADGEGSEGVVSPEGAWPVILDVATDEEQEIANECLRLIQKRA